MLRELRRWLFSWEDPGNAMEARYVARIEGMMANTEFSGRIIEIDHETSTLLIRYEGAPPDAWGVDVVVVSRVPVAYQHCYPDGSWRVNNGEPIDGLRPIASRPLYAPLEP